MGQDLWLSGGEIIIFDPDPGGGSRRSLQLAAGVFWGQSPTKVLEGGKSVGSLRCQGVNHSMGAVGYFIMQKRKSTGWLGIGIFLALILLSCTYWR